MPIYCVLLYFVKINDNAITETLSDTRSKSQPGSNIVGVKLTGSMFHAPVCSALATDRLNLNKKSSTRKFWLNYIIRKLPYDDEGY